MQEFIDMVTQQLGLGEKETKSATSGILNQLKGQLDDSTFSDLLAKIPGASRFLDDNPAEDESSAGGGLLGSLTSMAGGLLGGGKAGGVAGLAATLASSGISLDKVGGFITMLMTFLKDKLGADTFNSLAAQLPDMFNVDNNGTVE